MRGEEREEREAERQRETEREREAETERWIDDRERQTYRHTAYLTSAILSETL